MFYCLKLLVSLRRNRMVCDMVLVCRGMVCYSMVWDGMYCVVWCNNVTVWYSVLWHDMRWCDIIWYGIPSWLLRHGKI